MPASAASRRQLYIGVTLDASGVEQKVRPAQQTIRDLSNEITRASNEFRLGAISADRYADELLDIRNSAIDLAQGLNRSSQEYRDLTTAAARADRELDNFGQSSNRAGGAISLLGKGLGALGIAFGAQEVARYAIDVSRMAEQADRSRQAVIALAGSTAEANRIIGAIREAGGGAISQLDATGFAARALALGLADSSQEAALFTRTVTVLGASVGKDASESFDQLQLALANLSFERLDSLGISASNVRVRFQELRKAGIESSEAFRVAVLDEAAGRLRELEAAGFDASTGTEELNAAWSDLSLTLGNALAPAYQNATTKLAEGLVYVDQNIEQLAEFGRVISYVASLPTAIPRGALEQYIALDAASQKATGSIFKLTEETNKQIGTFDSGIGVGGVFGNTLDFVAQAADAAAGGISRANAILGAFTGTMANAIGIADGLGSAILRLGAAQAAQSSGNALEFAQFNLQNAQGALDGASTIRGRINALAGVVEAQNQVANAEERIVAEKKQAATEWINSTLRQQRASERAATAGTRAASAAAREQEKLLREQERAYEQAYNRIGGFVDRALSFRGGVQPFDDLLDRTGVGRNENATDEMIRRLEDVRDRGLEGTRSPWITEFLGLDDANLEIVAARAERLIRDLQDESKSFELIPFDQFLQDVRELEEAERRRLEFRDRAIQALGAGSTAAVDKALGLEGVSSDTGTALAENVATTLQAGIEAEQARFKAAGTLGAQYFESGFNEPLRGIVRRMLEDELNLMTQDIAA